MHVDCLSCCVCVLIFLEGTAVLCVEPTRSTPYVRSVMVETCTSVYVGMAAQSAGGGGGGFYGRC